MVNQSLTSQRSRSRMIIFQIAMSPEMLDEIEAIARKESLTQKRSVSRSSTIRDLCRESLDRRRQENSK
jgi:metal-responsive CopG/Arc/MetJ family transcriptional regulator